jgi:hypothetical protein
MVNYQLGKIYKIVGNGKIYVGSTCERLLCQRLSSHFSSYNRFQNGTSKKQVSSYECLNDPNHHIELLELYPCNSKDELHKCERKWIEQLDCINKNIPGRTKREYNEANKDKNYEQHKQWNERNKEHIKLYEEAYKDRRNELQRQRYLKKKQTNYERL